MKSKSLSRAFILQVLLILFVCQGGLFFWSYFQERRSLTESLDQKVRIVSRLLVNASIKGLFDYDLNYLGLLIDEILKDEDFNGVALKNEKGLEALSQFKSVKGNSLKKNYPVFQGEKEIGSLEISYTSARIDKLLRERIMLKAGLQLLILTIISLVLFYYFRKRVAIRINTMCGVVEKLTEGELSERIQDSYKDEIGRVAIGIDNLGERLKESISRITDFSASVASTTINLSESFKETTTALSHQYEATNEISQAISSATNNQTQISINARRLHEFSKGNLASVTENLNVSQGVANRIDALNEDINNAYATILEIDTSAKGVAGLAEEAACEVENAVSSSTAIQNAFSDIERIVGESNELSEKTTQVITDKGITAVSDTQQSMDRIHALSESLRATIGKLGEGSKDIAKVLSVITEITDKTKLLALNASIIAAQAGEHGRGFAVVANEMKMLSDKTAQSTTEIGAILNSIHRDIADAVKETGEATHIVREGSMVVKNAGIALNEILAVSQSSQEKVGTIQQATQMQKEQLNQVTEALAKLREVNFAVSLAARNEESSISAVGKSIGELRNTMEAVRLSTEQQVVSMQAMMNNTEQATTRTSDIVNAVHEAQQVNGAICASLREVVDVGTHSSEDINNAAERILTLRAEVESLIAEMEKFKT